MEFNQENYQKVLNYIEHISVEKNKEKAKIIAISKNHPQSSVLQAIKAGVQAFGENKVQEAENKFLSLKRKFNQLELHLTGPLQTNKVKKALSLFNYFHTLDREKLAKEFYKHIKNADLVITGEGRVDSQTAFGKTPSGVAKAARKHNISTIVIGGGITDNANDIFSFGIEGLESACARDMSLDEAIKNSRQHLANATERAIRLVLIGKKIAIKKRK